MHTQHKKYIHVRSLSFTMLPLVHSFEFVFYFNAIQCMKKSNLHHQDLSISNTRKIVSKRKSKETDHIATGKMVYTRTHVFQFSINLSSHIFFGSSTQLLRCLSVNVLIAHMLWKCHNHMQDV